ncbi:MAG: DUF202 domain-containing protein [Armatimonadetes bacterium]|nr:DUF202 domain-containing protein [Armatimonadota bacterium]
MNDDDMNLEGRPDSWVRDHLANERTYLAWLRTGFTLIGLGFVAVRPRLPRVRPPR